MRINERSWSGQIISWIKEAINNGTTLFEDATNDEGIKVASGRTKFPDILLFTDKVAGIVFNGWELKFPDTDVEDREMLENALEKAKRLNANSFVTWNGAEAILWKVNDANYALSSLKKLKVYPKEHGINSREDLADRNNYHKHEPQLKQRLNEILHDLEQLYKSGELKNAINISSNIVDAITQVSKQFIPQFKNEIQELKSDDYDFRKAFNQWKIIEGATLKILSTSSRRIENLEPEEVLSKFTYYKLIGKILFYLTLSENLTANVEKLEIKESKDIKNQLNHFFSQAQKIDYQAVFESDSFTDKVPYNATIEELLFKLINIFNEFDFKVLPTEVIGHVLENLVPKEEKQKFGQYFTSETLANLVTFSAVKTRNDILFDPTSGTGTFLNSFYQTLLFYGNRNHQQILNQIWGNDISHFPATLSVINLYKQKVNDITNFPRVIRENYFNLAPHQTIPIPDNQDLRKINQVPIPKFDAIISNFPFIRQEDIPKEELNDFFEKEFGQTQTAFLRDKKFNINGKSDYYIYCFYNSLKFLKNDGTLASITSNAWLGKNYGLQFKTFLLNNFHIKYLVRSKAEHWFEDSKVSTIFITLEKKVSDEPTRFVTINKKLDEIFASNSLQVFEDFYTEIENCDSSFNNNWKADEQMPSLFHKNDGTISVSIIEKQRLLDTLNSQENWLTFFVSQNPFKAFEDQLVHPFPNLYDTKRGTRTGWDSMYIIPQSSESPVEKKFLTPYLKSPSQISEIEISTSSFSSFLFTCEQPKQALEKNYPKAYNWINKFENSTNKNNTKTIKEKGIDDNHKPYWYSISPNTANIVIAINPYKKLFFSYSKTDFATNQRLTAISVDNENLEIIVALLNSVISLLIVELNGVSRNLGALDLNANFFKSKMRILNPDLLSNAQIENILNKFSILKQRKIKDYNEEYQQNDRMAFDKVVLQSYGIDIKTLPYLYSLLTDRIKNRVELKNK